MKSISKKFEEDPPDVDTSFNEDDGIIIIPASKHGFADGNILLVESVTAGKQLNFMADGVADYEVPESIPAKQYSLACEVCTVSSKQTNFDGSNRRIRSQEADQGPLYLRRMAVYQRHQGGPSTWHCLEILPSQRKSGHFYQEVCVTLN